MHFSELLHESWLGTSECQLPPKGVNTAVHRQTRLQQSLQPTLVPEVKVSYYILKTEQKHTSPSAWRETSSSVGLFFVCIKKDTSFRALEKQCNWSVSSFLTQTKSWEQQQTGQNLCCNYHTYVFVIFPMSKTKWTSPHRSIYISSFLWVEQTTRKSKYTLTHVPSHTKNNKMP